MGGGGAGDEYDGVIPFETIVKKGLLVKDIEDRKQALVDQCRSNSGLTLQEVIDHNDWMLSIERDLGKARARIEREFRISNALSLKVREGKRKAQLQQRLDTLRSQCDVLNECIHSISDHRAWFRDSGTYKEALDYLEGRRDEEDGTFDELKSAIEQRAVAAAAASAGISTGAAAAAAAVIEQREAGSIGGGGAGGGGGEDRGAGEECTHHELDGFILADGTGASASDKRRRKKKRGKKGANQGLEEAKDGGSEDDDDGEGGQVDGLLGPDALVADFQWLRSMGQGGSGVGYVDVWAPD